MPEVLHDNLDDRREIHQLLARLSPLKRVAFVDECCRNAVLPGSAIRPGEIVGLAGLMGSGRTEIAEAIFGRRAPVAGTVTFDGQPIRGQHDAIERGIALVIRSAALHRAPPFGCATVALRRGKALRFC